MDTNLLQQVNSLLSSVFDPRLGPAPGKDLVSAKMLGKVALEHGALSVEIILPYAALGETALWQERVRLALAGIAPGGKVEVRPVMIY